MFSKKHTTSKDALENIARWTNCFVKAYDKKPRKPTEAGIAMVETIGKYAQRSINNAG